MWILLATAVGDFASNLASGLIGVLVGSMIPAIASWRAQKREFDHRLRMEKEYSLYTDLWDKLFELRRAVGQLIETLGTTAAVDHGAQVPDRFNAYQSSVRKGEPFLHDSVGAPAREIAGLARTIVSNVDRQKELRELSRDSTPEKSDWYATQILELDESSETTFAKLDEMYVAVCEAIRKRVTVR